MHPHPQTHSSLCQLPPELLDCIFFELTVDDDALNPANPANHGPLGQLLPVLVACRYLHGYLNPGAPASAALYRRIFLHKFDALSVARRAFSPHSSDYPDQLILYQDNLHIIASGNVKRCAAQDALSVAYLMMLENDGKNRLELERVGAYDFAQKWIHERLHDGSQRNDGWPLPSEANGCAMWLMWMCTTEERLRAESDVERNAFIKKILPFVANPYRYTSAETPPNHFSLPLPSTVGPLIEEERSQLFSRIPTAHGPYPIYSDGRKTISHFHFSSRLATVTPSLTVAAKLLYFVRRELRPFPLLPHFRTTRAQADAEGVTQVGPTREDVLEVNAGSSVRLAVGPTSSFTGLSSTIPAPPSMAWDYEWERGKLQSNPFETDRQRLARLSGIPTYAQKPTYEPGMLTGLWQGRLLFPNTLLLHEFLQTPEFPQEGFTEATLGLAALPFFVRFQEHVCYYPDEPVPSYVTTNPQPHSQHQHQHLNLLASRHQPSIHHENLQHGWFPYSPTYPPTLNLRDPFFYTPNNTVAGDHTAGSSFVGPMTMFHFDSDKQGGSLKIRLTQPVPGGGRTEWTYRTWRRDMSAKNHDHLDCDKCTGRDEWEDAELERERRDQRRKGKSHRSAQSSTPSMTLAPQEENMFQSVGLGGDDADVHDEDMANVPIDSDDAMEDEDAEMDEDDDSDDFSDLLHEDCDGDAGIWDSEGRQVSAPIRPAYDIDDEDDGMRSVRRFVSRAAPDDAMDVESEGSSSSSASSSLGKRSRSTSSPSRSSRAKHSRSDRASPRRAHTRASSPDPPKPTAQEDAQKPKTSGSRRRKSASQSAATCRGIRDIIVTGSTDYKHGRAWNDYVYFGRVRSWDGLIGILRRPKGRELGDLFMYGYLVGGKGEVDLREGLLTRFSVPGAPAPEAPPAPAADAPIPRGTPGTFVGNWRNVFDVSNLPPWECAFIMTRRAE